MILSSDTIDRIKDFGKFKYPPEKLIILLQLQRGERDLFLQEFYNEDSVIRMAYEQGMAEGDHDINKALKELADAGDATAASELSKRQLYANIDRIKKELFGI